MKPGTIQVGQAGGHEPFMDSGEEHRDVQFEIGNLVAVGVRDPLDEAVAG